MKRVKIFAGLAGMTLALSFAWIGLAQAHSFRTGTNVTLGQSKAVNHTIFASGRNIDLDGEVFGDVFCAGQTVTVSGTVHGDVICAGQTVRVTGTVTGDVRLAGQTVTLGANVMGNATAAGQTFTLESGGKIGGDASIGSSGATFNGPVGRDIAVSGDSVVVAGAVGRDIKGTVTDLRLESGAQVNGSINFTSANDVHKANGAVVTGKVTRSEPQKPDASKRWAIFGFGMWWFLYWFAAMLLTAMVIALLFPRMLQSVTDKARPKPWKALLTGFLASVSLPFVLFLLAITVVGIPLALMLAFLWIVVILLSGPLFGYYLGRLILRNSRQPLLIMLVGASVLMIAYFIPLIGFIAFLAAVWIGSGSLLLEIFQKTPKPKYNLEHSSGGKAKS